MRCALSYGKNKAATDRCTRGRLTRSELLI
jgi:hypothetical protein